MPIQFTKQGNERAQGLYAYVCGAELERLGALRMGVKLR